MKRVAEGAYVISAVADRNFRFGLNPDVEDVLEMNQCAKKRECHHAKQSTIYNDETGHASYNICRVCSKILPPAEAARGGR